MAEAKLEAIRMVMEGKKRKENKRKKERKDNALRKKLSN